MYPLPILLIVDSSTGAGCRRQDRSLGERALNPLPPSLTKPHTAEPIGSRTTFPLGLDADLRYIFAVLPPMVKVRL